MAPQTTRLPEQSIFSALDFLAKTNPIVFFSYIDATGLPKHVAYVADDWGFRVTSSNALPIAPALPEGH